MGDASTEQDHVTLRQDFPPQSITPCLLSARRKAPHALRVIRKVASERGFVGNGVTGGRADSRLAVVTLSFVTSHLTRRSSLRVSSVSDDETFVFESEVLQTHLQPET